MFIVVVHKVTEPLLYATYNQLNTEGYIEQVMKDVSSLFYSTLLFLQVQM